ncbi:uncharacterized protein PSFLO_00206 [Pseudozyma flocculosa]|uniref:AB hydrolase-1 domain-containing protein n=2 Tax=Pseudozyma flocculosa TaxID=84751 RepID=A0A5C3ESN7_9BASI|nr:uncharacterized protein PSFLO_00206 [Pseudozyma flocculosa]
MALTFPSARGPEHRSMDAPPTSAKPRSGSSYFERYPERKAQGPYTPRSTLLPTAGRRSSPNADAETGGPSPPLKDTVRFPTRTHEDASLQTPPAAGPSRSRPPPPRAQQRSSPGDRKRVEASAQPPVGPEKGAPVLATVPAATAGFASLAKRMPAGQEVSSTYAASSAALGKSRAKPDRLRIKAETVPSIDDIIRRNADALKASQPSRSPSMPRSAPSGGTGMTRQTTPGEVRFPSYDWRKPASAPSAPARNGVEICVHSNASESSLDSVEQEIWEGMRRYGAIDPTSDGADPGSRRRSFSEGVRGAGPGDASAPFAQVRAFQSLAQLHVSPVDEAAPPLPGSTTLGQGLQEPFVESRTQSKPRAGAKSSLTDRFKPADGGSLTESMSIHSGPGRPYRVSYADVGARAGSPVFVFLGLGAVRHLVGLYDELAAALGLRLICIDRWGLGRSDDVPMERRSILAWSAVVNEVADRLGLARFSLLAHSAGAPYAMATALVFGERLVGPVHLLSPFTGASAESGYRWLRYVPDGVIRTAQVADWKLQGWKLAKAANGVSHDTPKSTRASETSAAGTPASFVSCQTDWNAFSPARGEGATAMRRTESDSSHAGAAAASGLVALPSSTSTTTLGPSPTSTPSGQAGTSAAATGPTLNKKASFSFLGGLLGARQAQSESSSPTSDAAPATDGSGAAAYRGRPGRHRYSLSRSVSISSTTPSCASQEKLTIDERCEWLERSPSDGGQRLRKPVAELPHSRSTGTLSSEASRRQSRAPSSSGDSASIYSTPERGLVIEPDAGLGVALLRASHSESQRGSASDLSLVLGKKPWGFDFTDVRHPCRIWHGSRDERVSLASAKWMERSLDDCRLHVVEGAGHNLMTNTAVIFEVLESIKSFATPSSVATTAAAAG